MFAYPLHVMMSNVSIEFVLLLREIDWNQLRASL